MALNRSDKSRILRRYFPGMTRNSEMSTEPSDKAGRLQSNVAYRFLLILSLSKDAHTSHRWFDRLTMSG